VAKDREQSTGPDYPGGPTGSGGAASIVPAESIQSRILLIRGQKVILDADLAELYGAPTKRLNEQVKRNIERFPTDFMFTLTAAEKAEVVANCDHLRRLKFSPARPSAFTEHGAIMAAGVLNSARAVQTSLFVVRAFVRLRRLLESDQELATRLDHVERTLGDHDRQIVAIVDAIELLMPPPPEEEPPREPFGLGRVKKN
jgi:hypothetical protein